MNKAQNLMYIKLSKQILKSNKVKITKARINILEIFNKSKSPISAYKIQEIIGKKADITTIYRNLDLLEKNKLVHQVKISGGYFKCAFLGSHGVHSFMVCESCDSTEEFISPMCCSEHELKATKEKKFRCQNHFYEILGKCSTCTN